MIPRLALDGFDTFVHRTRTRFPFRYGIASMTEVPHLFVRCRVRVGDQSVVGLTSEGLPPKWFTKDPDTSFERDLADMFLVVGRALAVTCRIADQPLPFFDLWHALEHDQSDWAARTQTPPLLAHLGVSLCERALLDALCRHARRPLHSLLRDNALGLRLGEIHPQLESLQPAHLLPDRPLPSLLVRHTVGLADPLSPAEIPAADRVDDGLPQDLEACLQTSRLRALKIKLTGQPTRDLPRLRAIQSLVDRHVPSGLLVTLDANENFQTFAAFREFWRELAADPAVQGLLRALAAVEQPVHRQRALDDDAGRHLAEWRDRPRLIIDESDGALGDLPRALALGYHGTSHKNCKGIVKGIANACLLEHRRRQGQPAVLTGEDLCNLGPVALLQDLALMSLLGIEHVERNGHHYYRGLTPWPAEWQDATLAAHPDLYQRHPLGFVHAAVRDGRFHLDSLNAAPFGVQPLFDPARFDPIQLPGGQAVSMP